MATVRVFGSYLEKHHRGKHLHYRIQLDHLGSRRFSNILFVHFLFWWCAVCHLSTRLWYIRFHRLQVIVLRLKMLFYKNINSITDHTAVVDQPKIFLWLLFGFSAIVFHNPDIIAPTASWVKLIFFAIRAIYLGCTSNACSSRIRSSGATSGCHGVNVNQHYTRNNIECHPGIYNPNSIQVLPQTVMERHSNDRAGWDHPSCRF